MSLLDLGRARGLFGSRKLKGFMQTASRISVVLGFVASLLNVGCTLSSSKAVSAASANSLSVASDIGSTFVHAKVTGLCGDGQIIDSQIELRSGAAYLTRDNCVDIPSVSQNQVLTQFNPLDSSYVVYNTMTYTDSLSSFNESAVDASGNIYALLMQTAPITLNQYRLIIKLSAQGSLLWSKRLPTDFTSNLTSLRLTHSGNLVVAGETYQQSAHAALLIALDPQGQILTQAAFAPGATEVANFRDLDVDSTGNIYAVAEIHHASDNIVDCVVMKISSTGQILWQQGLSNLNAWISQIRLTTDETELYVSGHFDLSSYLGGVVKFTSDGVQEWSSNLPGTVYTIENSFDGGLMLAGIVQASNESFVAKLAGAGLVAWSTSFSTPDESLGYTRGLTQRADGSFIVNGLAIRNGGTVVGTVTSLTSAGALDWSFEVSRTGADAFQDGESALLDGKIWMPLRSTIPNYGLLGTLFQFVDQAVQPTCTLCTVRSDVAASDVALTLAAGSSFTAQTLLNPVSLTVALTNITVHPDIRP